jgi:cyanophycin synthetase
VTRDLHQYRIIDAAHRLGSEVTDLADRWHLDAVRLSYDGREEIVVDGRIFSNLRYQAELLTGNKQACKDLMHALGIPVPAGLVFSDYDARAPEVARFLETHRPAVCKPLVAAHGRGVEMNITTPEQVRAYYASHRTTDPVFLLEAQAAGHDLRLQAIGGELVAACTRVPAAVTGDGEQSVAALIAARNALLATQNPANRIERDDQLHGLLGDQGLTLSAVVPAGQRVQLKRVSNMAQGGTAVDVTDAVHPHYGQWIRRAAVRLDLRIFSLDVITTDHTQPPEAHAVLLELNTNPDWLHHTFSEGRQHDIPALILQSLFNMV